MHESMVKHAIRWNCIPCNKQATVVWTVLLSELALKTTNLALEEVEILLTRLVHDINLLRAVHPSI